MLYNCKSLYVSQLSRERLSRACKMVPLGQQDRKEKQGGAERSLPEYHRKPCPSSSFSQDTDRDEQRFGRHRYGCSDIEVANLLDAPFSSEIPLNAFAQRL